MLRVAAILSCLAAAATSSPAAPELDAGRTGTERAWALGGRAPAFWFQPDSACTDLGECADAVDRACTRKASSGESVEVSNNVCGGRCANGGYVVVLCA